MKVEEILKHLHESFDFKVDLKWKQIRNSYYSIFDLDDREYKIEIKYFDLSELIGQEYKNSYEVSFTEKDKNSKRDYTYDAPGGNPAKHSIKVFSIVINGVQKKLKEIRSIDLVFFNAKDTDAFFEERASLYQRLTSTLSKRLNMGHFFKTYPKFELYILSNYSITEEVVDYIVNLVNSGE
jgi:hypothetical protein